MHLTAEVACDSNVVANVMMSPLFGKIFHRMEMTDNNTIAWVRLCRLFLRSPLHVEQVTEMSENATGQPKDKRHNCSCKKHISDSSVP